MMGLVLWYNPEQAVGIVWCEDQGPLAYMGPDIEILYDSGRLSSGMQIVFRYKEIDGVRHVREIFSLMPSPGDVDLPAMLKNLEEPRTNAGALRVVA